MAYGYAKSTGGLGVYSCVPGTRHPQFRARRSQPPMPPTRRCSASPATSRRPRSAAVTASCTRCRISWRSSAASPNGPSASTTRRRRRGLRAKRSAAPRAAARDRSRSPARGTSSSLRAPVSFEPPAALDPPPEPDPVAVARAATLIAGARRPLIMLGSGAVDAGEAVLALARRLQAPVTAHRNGRGIVGEDLPYGMSLAAALRLLADRRPAHRNRHADGAAIHPLAHASRPT